VIGIDRAKMRLYDCEQSAQNDIIDSKNYGDEDYRENSETKKYKKQFDGFKFE